MRLGTRTVALLLALIVVAAFVVPTTMAKAAKPDKKENGKPRVEAGLTVPFQITNRPLGSKP